MKKILLFIILFYPVILFAQFSGSGTYGDPYSGGTLTGDMTWYLVSSPIYVSGDLTIGTPSAAGHLIIQAGVTIRFCSTGAELIITGLGQLTADGTSTSQIRFTADTDKDGIYGETGEIWGHISFVSMDASASQSVFDYCILEYGDVSSGSSTTTYGGAIYTAFSNLDITNSIIRYNKATHGGGILVLSSGSPNISTCSIVQNTASTSGGGVYFYTGSASVTNSLITFNSTGTGGGGGVFLDACGNVRVTNSTIAKNTSSSSDRGQNIQYYNISSPTNRPSFTNCIAWGNDNSITHLGYGQQSTDFVYSAIQDISTPASYYSSCIDLSGTNGDATGPNFNATDGSDWSIKFISPCRDAGTTPSPTIPNDYIGKPRIGLYDIGAYEVQYSRWTGASGSSWTISGNWEDGITPSTGTGDVIIPSAGITNYPDETTVTIGTGNYLIIDPLARATFGTLNNNSTGTLWLKSDSHGINDSIASLKVNTYNPNSGTAKIELYLQGNSSMWHYISPPVASLAATTFSTASAAVAKYREDLIEDDMNNGWVTSTGYHYDVTLGTPAWVYNAGWTWSDLYSSFGYNYYSATSKTFNITGTINTGDQWVSLVYNSGEFTPDNPYHQGYNLIGNPFTCSLDWDLVVEDPDNVSVWYDAEVTIYFRKNGITYYYNYGSGETVPDDYNSDGNLIPPMQGFFIKTNAAVQLTIPEEARVHSPSMRYKGNKSVPKIRLQLENTETTDQTLIWFSEKATSSFDNLYDARKLFISESSPYIYSSLEGIKYAINGIAFPENSVTVPLVVNANNTGVYTIKATQIAGLENYTIYLRDEILDNTVNLSQVSSYSFNTTAGLSTDRFSIIVTNILTAIPENKIIDKPFNIYSSGEQINIQTLSDDWSGRQGEVKILDFTGRIITLQRNVEFSKDEIKQIGANSLRGLYLVEIRSGAGRYVGKVVIK